MFHYFYVLCQFLASARFQLIVERKHWVRERLGLFTISYFLISKVILRWNIHLSMLNIKTRGWASPPSWSAFGRKWSAFSFASANFIQRNSNGYLLAIYICKAICLSAVIYIRIQDPWLVNQPSAMTVLAESARSVIGQLQAITVQPDAIAARCGLTLNAAVWPPSNI